MLLYALYLPQSSLFFFFTATATTEIYTLSLHDALPISRYRPRSSPPCIPVRCYRAPMRQSSPWPVPGPSPACRVCSPTDRKSTRLNSSHSSISYAVFCLKKKTNNNKHNKHDSRLSTEHM